MTSTATSSYLFCAVGDSRTVGLGSTPGHDPLTLLAKQIESRYSHVRCHIQNQAVNGTTTAFWNDETVLTHTLQAFAQKAAAVGSCTTLVQIMLGINDAGGHARIPAPAYVAGMQRIIDAVCAAAIPGFAGVVMHESFYTVPGGFSPAMDQRCLDLVVAYNALLPTLKNPGRVYLGDRRAYRFFANRPELLFDKLHCSDAGNAELARLWFESYSPIIDEIERRSHLCAT